MGTTLTGALLSGDGVSIVHVGDSRAYLFRDGELRQLTRDHSLVEELRRRGQLTPEEAEDHPQRSIITRALGPEPDVELDVHTHQARGGDVFLLCSDGLTSMVREDRLRAILSERGHARQGASIGWSQEANNAGGRDNITVVAFRVGGDDEGARPGPTPRRPTRPSWTSHGGFRGGHGRRRRAPAATSAAAADRSGMSPTA